ncbi:MAG: hypothetical protein LBH59_07000 [Planctomycetaceae bacterium]|jgi:hypothetical protein|nr:hypothetical protein [Planctomycetaceae bacterium]
MLKPFKNQEAEHGKRSIAKRLFKGEAYRPYRLRYNIDVLFVFCTITICFVGLAILILLLIWQW